jgi:hypothetical protein
LAGYHPGIFGTNLGPHHVCSYTHAIARAALLDTAEPIAGILAPIRT